VVSEGKIKELGTHDELIALNGLYADLVSTILPSTLPFLSLSMPSYATSRLAFACFALPCLSLHALPSYAVSLSLALLCPLSPGLAFFLSYLTLFLSVFPYLLSCFAF
jgi:hypothetical protein